MSWQPGSTLYAYAVFFAKVLPILVGLSILLGLVLAWRGERQTAPKAGGGNLQRHNLSAVFEHWAITVGCVICIATGTMLLRWVGRSLALESIYVVHYVGAGLMVLAASPFVTHHLVAGNTSLLPDRSEPKHLVAEFAAYLGVFGPEMAAFRFPLPGAIRKPLKARLAKMGIEGPPKAGKYHSTERALSFPVWVIFLGAAVLTGIIKSLRYTFPMPGALLYWSTIIHDLTTTLTLLWLIVHVASLTVIPVNWPLLKSMFTRKVPEAYVKEHHLEWYQELSATQNPKVPATMASPEHDTG